MTPFKMAESKIDLPAPGSMAHGPASLPRGTCPCFLFPDASGPGVPTHGAAAAARKALANIGPPAGSPIVFFPLSLRPWFGLGGRIGWCKTCLGRRTARVAVREDGVSNHEENNENEGKFIMMNRKTRIMIACAVAALAAILGTSSFLTAPAWAWEQPTETTGITCLSDVEDGYDAEASGIRYEIEVPAF